MLQAMLSVDTGNVIDNAHTTGTIHWNFDSDPQAFDFLATGETLQLTYTIRATDSDASHATDDQTVVVNITGTNDAPVIAADTGVHGLAEGDTALTTSGTLAVSDADVTNTVAASVVGLSVAGSRPAGLTDAVLQAMLSVDAGNVIDNAHTTGTIHWNFDSDSQAFDFLATGETLQLTYTIRAIDSDVSHATDDQTVVVTITGTNDAPVITADTSGTAGTNVHDLTEGNAALTDSGSLAVSDADVTNTVAASVVAISVGGNGISSRPGGLTDAVLQAMLSVDAGNVIDNTHTAGTIHWNFDSDSQAFDFLATGETLTLTYTIRGTDSDLSHATDDQTVVINITGTNDAPVIAADTSGTAGTNVHDLTEGNAALTDSGSLAVSDPDVTNTVAASVYGISVGGTGNGSRPAGLTDAVLQAMLSVDTGNVIDNAHTSGTIHWNFDSDPQAFDFLATGETLQLTYTIRAIDSDASHATDDQVVVVNIHGTNGAPVISTADVQVSGGSFDGLSVSDADASPAEFFTVTAAAASGSSVTFAAGTSPGTLAGINTALDAGIIYHPGTTPPPTDIITLTVADAAGATDKLNLIFNVADPGSTPITLASTSEKDVLFGTVHEDQFVFEANSNRDTIVDFTAGIDHIDLSALSAIVAAANISSFLENNVTSLGGDTLITLDSHDTITLPSVALCSLHASDFIVHAG